MRAARLGGAGAPASGHCTCRGSRVCCAHAGGWGRRAGRGGDRPASPLAPSCRYYFKKVSDEFDCGVVFEEVREDEAVLPVFEEKIIGKVEKVD